VETGGLWQCRLPADADDAGGCDVIGTTAAIPFARRGDERLTFSGLGPDLSKYRRRPETGVPGRAEDEAGAGVGIVVRCTGCRAAPTRQDISTIPPCAYVPNPATGTSGTLTFNPITLLYRLDDQLDDEHGRSPGLASASKRQHADRHASQKRCRLQSTRRNTRA